MQIKNLKNSILSIADVILYPTIFLLCTPYFVHHMGSENYGIWMLANTIVVFFQVFNFGLGLSTQRNVALSIGEKDFVNVSRIVGLNFSTAFLISIICVLAGIIISAVQYNFNTFHISKIGQPIAVVSISFAGGIAGIKFLEQILTNTLIAFERIALVSIYNSISRMMILCSTFIIVYFNYNILFVFVLNILIQILGLVLLNIWVTQSIGQYTFNLSINKSVILSEFQLSKWIWFQSILVILAFQCDKFFVVHLFGVVQFSYYSISSMIFNHIHLAIMAITPWAIPQLSKKYAQKSDIQEYYFSMRSTIHLLAHLGIFILSLVYKPLFSNWMGEHMMLQLSPYLKLFMIFELLLVFTISPFYLLNALGNGKLATKNTFVYCLFSIVGMILGYLMAHTVEGLLMGSIIGLFIAFIIQQILIAQSQGFNVFQETIWFMLPTISLALFIIDFHSLQLKLAFAMVSILSSLYIYTIKFPIRGDFLSSLLIFKSKI